MEVHGVRLKIRATITPLYVPLPRCFERISVFAGTEWEIFRSQRRHLVLGSEIARSGIERPPYWAPPSIREELNKVLRVESGGNEFRDPKMGELVIIYLQGLAQFNFTMFGA